MTQENICSFGEAVMRMNALKTHIMAHELEEPVILHGLRDKETPFVAKHLGVADDSFVASEREALIQRCIENFSQCSMFKTDEKFVNYARYAGMPFVQQYMYEHTHIALQAEYSVVWNGLVSLIQSQDAPIWQTDPAINIWHEFRGRLGNVQIAKPSYLQSVKNFWYNRLCFCTAARAFISSNWDRKEDIASQQMKDALEAKKRYKVQ